jgi:hypothetical protein
MFRANAASSIHSELFARYCQTRSSAPMTMRRMVTESGGYLVNAASERLKRERRVSATRRLVFSENLDVWIVRISTPPPFTIHECGDP